MISDSSIIDLAVQNFYITLVEEFWNIDDISTISMLGGFSAQNFLIKDKKQYILKKINKGASQNPLCIVSAAQTLAKFNIPVPQFLKTGNDSYFIEKEDCYYLIYEMIEGACLHGEDLQEQHLKEIRKYLFKLHQCSKPIFMAKRNEEGFFDLILKLQRTLDTHSLEDNYKSVIENNLERKVQIIKQLEHQHRFTNDIVQEKFCLTHEDFHNENIIFSSDHSIAAVIDFDRVHMTNCLNIIFAWA